MFVCQQQVYFDLSTTFEEKVFNSLHSVGACNFDCWYWKLSGWFIFWHGLAHVKWDI